MDTLQGVAREHNLKVIAAPGVADTAWGNSDEHSESSCKFHLERCHITVGAFEWMKRAMLASTKNIR